MRQRRFIEVPVFPAEWGPIVRVVTSDNRATWRVQQNAVTDLLRATAQGSSGWLTGDYDLQDDHPFGVPTITPELFEPAAALTQPQLRAEVVKEDARQGKAEFKGTATPDFAHAITLPSGVTSVPAFLQRQNYNDAGELLTPPTAEDLTRASAILDFTPANARALELLPGAGLAPALLEATQGPAATAVATRASGVLHLLERYRLPAIVLAAAVLLFFFLRRR